MNEINKEERMQGLSGQQVSESKAKYGTNELAKKEESLSLHYPAEMMLWRSSVL